MATTPSKSTPSPEEPQQEKQVKVGEDDEATKAQRKLLEEAEAEAKPKE